MDDRCKKKLKQQDKCLKRTTQEDKVEDLKESYKLGKEYYEDLTKK